LAFTPDLKCKKANQKADPFNEAPTPAAEGRGVGALFLAGKNV